MYIAAKLKEDNIAEYVLYMWHTEDIIRAYDCDVDRIAREYVPRFGLDKAHSDALVAWYADLCRMMRSEGTETGIKDISAVIALLAAYYKENKKSPLKFDSDF